MVNKVRIICDIQKTPESNCFYKLSAMNYLWERILLIIRDMRTIHIAVGFRNEMKML